MRRIAPLLAALTLFLAGALVAAPQAGAVTGVSQVCTAGVGCVTTQQSGLSTFPVVERCTGTGTFTFTLKVFYSDSNWSYLAQTATTCSPGAVRTGSYQVSTAVDIVAFQAISVSGSTTAGNIVGIPVTPIGSRVPVVGGSGFQWD